MQNELTCPLCNKEYRDENLPRLLTTCGHTYCESCIKSLMKPIYLNNNNLIDLEENQQQKQKKDQQKQSEATPTEANEDREICQQVKEGNSNNQQKIMKQQIDVGGNNQEQQGLLDEVQNKIQQQKKDDSQKKEKSQEGKPDETNEESQERSKPQGDISEEKQKQEGKQQLQPKLVQKQGVQDQDKQVLESKHSKPNKQQKRRPQKYRIVCPDDKNVMETLTNQITLFPKNLALIKLIQSKKQNLSFKDDDSSFNVSKIAKTQQMQEDDQANDLITAIKQGEQADSKSLTPNQTESVQLKEDQQQDQKQKQPQICLLHQKPLEIVCMIDVMRICANCAIFGEHKGHDFKSLEQIQKQQDQYYSEILNLMDVKQVIQTIKQKICSHMENEETLNDLLAILETRKQKVKRDIKDRYKQLREELEKFEKQDIKNLDNLVDRTSLRIKNTLKIDQGILNNYLLWENESYQHIRILEGNNFQQKLQLTFPQNQQPNTVIQRGVQIINQIKKQQDNLLPQVQQIIEGIKIVNSDNIYKTLSSFVVVTEEAARKPELDSQILNNQTKKHQNDQHVMGSPHMEQSLLQTQELDQISIKKPQFEKKQFNLEESEVQIQKMESSSPIEKLNLDSIGSIKKEGIKEQFKINHKIEEKRQSNPATLRSNFTQIQAHQRPNKKKLSKMKIQQKYEKIIDGIANDALQNVDLSFAQLGDLNLSIICQFFRGSKAKNIKLIRNKLTDQGMKKIMPYFGNVLVLNLSQNMLTENVLDIFIQNFKLVPNLKNLILSQNKIVERKSKARLQKLRGLGLTVSV